MSPHGSLVPGLRTITPPGGCFGFGADFVILECEAVHHRAVHGDVFDADGIIGESFVEIVAVEQAAIGHDGIVIAIAHDHLAPGNLALGGVSLQLADDAWHVLTYSRWRGVKLALVGDEQ